MVKSNEQYTIRKKIGEGTYGAVYEVASISGKRLAIKENFLYPSTDFAGSLREMDFLLRLRGHPNIVYLDSVATRCPFTNPRQHTDPETKPDKIYFVMEYVEKNLRNFIYSSYDPNLVKKYMADILLGIEYMHSKKIIHRDLKPSNILWIPRTQDNLGGIKICDMGMCRNISSQGRYTPRVVSCWYRAPEICSDKDYTEKSDMWSVGLVFFEMITRRALLDGYEDHNSQLLRGIQNAFSRPLDNLLGNNPLRNYVGYPQLLDMLGHLLQPDPSLRYSATAALNHPYFADCHKYIQSIRAAYPPVDTFSYNVQISPGQWRDIGMQVAFALFNQRRTLQWYKHHIIFSAVALFDKYLIWLQQTSQKLSWVDIELRFMVCLYVSIKYNVIMDSPPLFTDLVDKQFVHEKLLEVAALAEEELVENVLGFNIYQPTIYDVAKDKLDETTIRDLLVFYGGLPHQQRQPGVLYNANVHELYSRFVLARGSR